MISVIIPAYNDVAGVLSCLNSLQALATQAHEFIVQDDASPEVDFRAVIHPAQARVSRNVVNLGFGGNCHAGAALAGGDLIAFVNQDIHAAPGWSDRWDAVLMSAFDDPAVGIVAPRLLFTNGAVQSCGGAFDALGQPIHRCIGWSNPHDPQIATAREVEWATGAFLVFRRECWTQIGGFDAGYRMYFEDADACLRARELGWKVWYEPRCTFVHTVGSTGGSSHFPASARRFKTLWLDSGKVKAGTAMPTVRYW
jgi:GT2 family glycosyltransferase